MHLKSNELNESYVTMDNSSKPSVLIVTSITLADKSAKQSSVFVVAVSVLKNMDENKLNLKRHKTRINKN